MVNFTLIIFSNVGFLVNLIIIVTPQIHPPETTSDISSSGY